MPPPRPRSSSPPGAGSRRPQAAFPRSSALPFAIAIRPIASSWPGPVRARPDLRSRRAEHEKARRPRRRADAGLLPGFRPRTERGDPSAAAPDGQADRQGRCPVDAQGPGALDLERHGLQGHRARQRGRGPGPAQGCRRRRRRDDGTPSAAACRSCAAAPRGQVCRPECRCLACPQACRRCRRAWPSPGCPVAYRACPAACPGCPASRAWTWRRGLRGNDGADAVDDARRRPAPRGQRHRPRAARANDAGDEPAALAAGDAGGDGRDGRDRLPDEGNAGRAQGMHAAAADGAPRSAWAWACSSRCCRRFARRATS